MTTTLHEQLQIVSPEYERAVANVFDTGNAILTLYPSQRPDHQDSRDRNRIYSDQREAENPNVDIVISKKLPEEGESLAEWAAKRPDITRNHYLNEGKEWSGATEMIVEKEGILYRKRSLQGDPGSWLEEMSIAEVLALEQQLAASVPYVPAPDLSPQLPTEE